MMISQAMMGAMVNFIDRLIFISGVVPIPFEVRRRAVCADCGREGKCYPGSWDKVLRYSWDFRHSTLPV